jgi:hypothetical protein
VERPVLEFSQFCPKYLHQDVYWHQQQWIDLLEGKTPKRIHPAQTYNPGRQELTIVNTPPEHAKSTTLTINYVTYRICQDPNVRIIVVSKTKEMATRFVYAIKNRLTHPRFRQLQLDFAPQEGFAGSADTWKSDQVYLGSEQRDSGEKDPTLLALGIGGQIYGARADLIIVDDAVTLSNAHEFEKQIEWLQQEVLTRLSDRGMLLVIGTRVAPQDLYSELQVPDRYADGTSPWTYLAQPAVLEFSDDPEQWKTLWPETRHGDQVVPQWDGRALNRRRAVVSPKTWAMAYMQQQVVENAVFSPEAVRGCVNGGRVCGPLPKGGLKGGREEGMDGLYLVAGLDPAMAGHTAATLLGVDRTTRMRYVLDLHNQAGMTPREIRDLIKRWTVKYGIHEWRIEKNAFQGMLTQDEEINQFLHDRGCVLKEHHTGKNKWDVDFGVASLSGLFDGWDARPKKNMIELPSSAAKGGEVVKQLIEQLITWAPETKGKTDMVMSLWFAEIRAREVCDTLAGVYHLPNRYATQRQIDRRMVINLDDAWQARQIHRV